MAKIALFCLDVIGKAMAGPAIRYWEFAKELSKRHQVALIIPNKTEQISSDFLIIDRFSRHYISHLMAADIIIAQQITPSIAFLSKMCKGHIILDAYDPMPLENLEVFKHMPMGVRVHKNNTILEQFRFSFHMADAVLCANEHQRSLWLGMIIALGRLTPQGYDCNQLMEQMIDIVPFGLSSTPPSGNQGALRQRFGLCAKDKVVLWGGGIWNWFDPLSLIRAIKILSDQRGDIKLVFMGVKHPNDSVPEMKMAREAVALARDLDLFDKKVFFNFDWVPYEERQSYLLDADVGASIHYEHLETRFAFRTRILDYIWSTLPIVATTGDCFAELIAEKQLGIVVPYGDPLSIAAAISEIVDDDQRRLAMRANLMAIRPLFHWERVIAPIEAMIHQLQAKATTFSLRSFASIVRSFYYHRGPTAIFKALQMKLALRKEAEHG